MGTHGSTSITDNTYAKHVLPLQAHQSPTPIKLHSNMYTNDDTLRFIAEHRNESVPQLALAAHKAPNVDLPFALDQIAGWQTACRKLPMWAENPNIVYPPHLSMEQCSSQTTAEYKANVASLLVKGMLQGNINNCDKGQGDNDEKQVDECEYTSLVDLTGGFGVDFAFMATRFTSATYVERQPQLCQLVQHNLNALNIGHAKVVCAEAESHLEAMKRVSCIYLDPARRDKNGGKTVLIEHCSPDILQLLPTLLAKCGLLMVKLSPMLHWQQAIAQLQEQGAWVRQLHIVSVKNECKELLFLITDRQNHGQNLSQAIMQSAQLHPTPLEGPTPKQVASPTNSTHITCFNDGDSFQYCLAEAEATPQNILQTPPQAGMFLFEPNASIMKAGCFGLLCSRLGVQAIAPNSHLFVANNDIPNFPGRRFKLVVATSFNKRDLKTALQGISKANIATRNFPLKPEALRKKLKLKDGGEHFIFATTDAQGKHWMLVGKG